MAVQTVAGERSPIRGISRNVFLLGLVSLFTDASTEMIYPLIPLFLTQVLGAPMAIVGVIEGLAEATASLLKGFSGWLSDRVGVRRPMVIFGYGLAAVAKPLLALATGWPLVLGARVIDRFGKGVRATPRDALIADSTEPALRGRAFGFHRSTDTIGAVVGPLLALPLLAIFRQNYRALFVAALVPAAIGVALLLRVRETGSRREKHATPPPSFRLRGADSRFKRFLAVMMLFAIGNSSDVFLILRAKQLGFSTAHIMGLFAAFNFIYAMSAYPAGHLSDRIGRRRVLVAGLVVFAFVYLGFGLASGAVLIWALFMIYGLYHGLTDGTMRAFVVDLVRPEHRATALGMLSTGIGLLAFAASAIAGLLWQQVGPPAPFFYGAATAGLAAILLAVLVPRRRTEAALS